MTLDEIFEIAEYGPVHAHIISFLCYTNGWSVERNDEQALKYLGEALVSGDPFAQYCAGSYFASRKNTNQDLITAFEWYQRSAEQGFAPAQHMVSGCYQFGHGVDVDPKKAKAWELKAAHAGFAPAQLGVAFMYREGIGAAKNLSSSFRWNMEAAKKGNADAACQVAGMYELGEGVARDEKAALDWYHRAAQKGSWIAHSSLAGIYRLGRLGVTPDLEKAEKHERFAEKLRTKLANVLSS
jgi:TPR repeat protein